MYEVGIESSSYFSKAFKKQYGVPPFQYLEQHKYEKNNKSPQTK
jgi:AraC-like DNA-binding protein